MLTQKASDPVLLLFSCLLLETHLVVNDICECKSIEALPWVIVGNYNTPHYFWLPFSFKVVQLAKGAKQIFLVISLIV